MIEARNDLEKAILQDPEILKGLQYGESRDGHPEGPVENHVLEILARIDLRKDPIGITNKLRFITIIHDSFKFRVDRRKPKIGENNHGVLARRFAERFTSDRILLNIIELHDGYYYLWKKFMEKGFFSESEFRLLADRVKDGLELYLMFIFIDGTTGDKSIEPRIWFYNELVKRRYLKNVKPV